MHPVGITLPMGFAKPEQYNLTLRLEPRHFVPTTQPQAVSATAELMLDVMRATSCLVRPHVAPGSCCARALVRAPRGLRKCHSC